MRNEITRVISFFVGTKIIGFLQMFLGALVLLGLITRAYDAKNAEKIGEEKLFLLIPLLLLLSAGVYSIFYLLKKNSALKSFYKVSLIWYAYIPACLCVSGFLIFLFQPLSMASKINLYAAITSILLLVITHRYLLMRHVRDGIVDMSKRELRN